MPCSFQPSSRQISPIFSNLQQNPSIDPVKPTDLWDEFTSFFNISQDNLSDDEWNLSDDEWGLDDDRNKEKVKEKLIEWALNFKINNSALKQLTCLFLTHTNVSHYSHLILGLF